jgi:hypothetical protein
MLSILEGASADRANSCILAVSAAASLAKALEMRGRRATREATARTIVAGEEGCSNQLLELIFDAAGRQRQSQPQGDVGYFCGALSVYVVFFIVTTYYLVPCCVLKYLYFEVDDCD